MATMTALPLVRVSQFRHVAEATELLGVSAAGVCRQLGQPAWHECDPDDHAPMAHMNRFMAKAARAAGSPTFGIAMMENLPVDRLGRLGCGIAGAAHVYEALRTSIRLVRGHTNWNKYWLVEKADAVWFCRGGGQHFEAGEEEASQYALIGMIQIVQRGAGARWWPEHILMQGNSEDAMRRVEALGGPRVSLHPELTAISVPRELLSLPILDRHVGSLAPRVVSLDEQGFLETAPAADLAPALKQLVATMLPHHYPSSKAMAEIVGVQPRTLQRTLQARSISYRQLVDEVRAEQATVLLRVGDASVTDIAFELGYTDPAHFTRAFRRWTGVSPRAYRSNKPAA